MQTRKNVITGYLILIYALTLLFVLINNFTGRSTEHWRFFYAFTQQSNIIALIWFSLLGVFLIKGTNKLSFTTNKIVMTAVTVYLSITYFIVALVLDPIYAGKFNPLSSGSELWLHHLTPIATWIILAIVPGKGELTIKKSLLTLIYPIAYVILNLIVGGTLRYENGDKAYAYGFINPDSYGGNYLILLGVILGLLLVFGLFTVGLSKFKIYIDGLENEKVAK